MTIYVLNSVEITELPFEQGQTILVVLQNHNITSVHAPCGMLISAVHKENDEEKLHLLMVDDHIPAGAKMY